MDYRFNRGLKVISSIVLFFFLWTFELSGIAYAIKNDTQPTAKSSSKSKPEKRSGKNIEDLDDILKSPADTETKRNKVKAKKAEIEADDAETRKAFIATEKTLKEKGLPLEILERHRKFVRHYEDNIAELKNNLDAIDKAKTEADTDVAIERTKAHLAKVKPPKKYKPLDPTKLPHRTPEEKQVIIEQWTPPAKPVIPPDFLKKTDIQNRKPVLVAANGSLKGLLNSDSQLLAANYIQVAQATTPQPTTKRMPTDADLAETAEIQFTPAIRAKAEELGYKPLKLYEWVRNNIEYVPTFGSIQGADMCLQTKQCNDADTASLLIALLRVSGVPAKYRYGTIELKIEKAMNWLGGFTDPMAALTLVASAGIPVKGLTEGGAIKYVQMEHLWVESWIKYMPSRGAIHKPGQGDMWIPLDASFKQYKYTQGIDVKSAVPFDAQSFIDQIKSSATINETQGYVTNVNSQLVQQTMQNYQSMVQGYVSQNYPNATVGDILGKQEIIKQEFPYLLGTLPYRPIARMDEYVVLPDRLRHKVSFSVTSDNIIYDAQPLNITKNLAELAGKRISLNYVPATEADKVLVDNYRDSSSIPAYLVNLKAELKIDNEVIATGPSIGMGTDQILNLSFTSPTKSETETHLLIAGDYNVVGLNIGGSNSLFEKRIAQGDYNDAVSEMLYQTILGYWAEYDSFKDIYAKTLKVASVRLPSEGLSSSPINITYMFGVPYSGSFSGRGLDIKRDSEVVTAIDGDKSLAKRFNQYAGMIGSAFEGFVLDQLFGSNIGDGISAMRLIDLSNSQGIPIYFINSGNINGILPNLQISTDVLNDIKNAVNSGKEVVVPRNNITHNGWTGSGYIIRDPNNGNGGYMIDGGSAGGFSIKAYMSATPMFEMPSASSIAITIQSWKVDVGPVAVAEASGAVEVATGWGLGDLIGGAMAGIMYFAMAFLIIAYLIYKLARTLPMRRWVTFRHYTTYCNLKGILSKGMLFATSGGCLQRWLEPSNTTGLGAYFTDFFREPDYPNPIGTSKEIKDTLGLDSLEKAQTYIEFKLNTTAIVPIGNPACPNEYATPFPILFLGDPNVQFYGRTGPQNFTGCQ